MAYESSGDPYDLKVLWESSQRQKGLPRSPIAAAERVVTSDLVIGWACVENTLTNSVRFYIHCEKCRRNYEDMIWPSRVSDITSAQDVLKQTLLQYARKCPHIGAAMPDLANMSPADVLPIHPPT